MSDSGTSDDDITADDPLLTLAATLVDDTPLAPYSPPSSDRGSPSSPMLLERKSALERRKRLAARAALSEPGMLEALLQPTALQSWLPPSSPLKEIAEVLREAAAEEEREDKGAGGGADFTSRLPVAWQTAGLLKGVIALLDAPQAVALLRTASAVATKRMVGDAACAEAFVNEGGLAALRRACGSAAPPATQEQSARTLGNLACHEGLAGRLVDAGCVSPLVERLSSDRQPLVEAALCAISNVSDNPEARVELVTRGLPTLLTLCAHDASAIHLQASWLLCLLAASAESSKTLLADAAALPAIFAHARRPSDSAQEEAAWALATLSADTQTSRQVGLADGACTLLLELLASPAASVSLQAAWALANLALQAEVMPKILEQPSVVPTLLAVAGRCHDDPSTSGLLKQVLRCLGTLAVAPEARRVLIQEGGVAQLATLLEKPHPEVLETALRVLNHACLYPQSAAAVVLEQLPSLSGWLAADAPAALQREAAATVANISYVASLRAPGGLGRIESGDLPKIESGVALSELAEALPDDDGDLPPELPTAVLEGFIVPLVTLLDSTCRRTQVTAATALCNVSAIGDCKVRVVEAGALAKLDKVAGSSCADAQSASRRALDAVTLALTPTSRRVFQPKGRNASPKYFAVGAGKADNRSSPLSAGASSFSPNRSGGGAAGGKREWKSPLLGD